ncbi:acylphosphatase [Candidatus Uhrbacteria bacterium]|nr:acylphosphatase [Candidatus Uhrbacteria bacterium]
MREHRDIIVIGTVQGIGFRASAKNQADRLSITGFVMNCQDGSVCIEAEGEQVNCDAFAHWCCDGPPEARVEHITNVQGELKGYTTFEIRRGHVMCLVQIIYKNPKPWYSYE